MGNHLGTPLTQNMADLVEQQRPSLPELARLHPDHPIPGHSMAFHRSTSLLRAAASKC